MLSVILMRCVVYESEVLRVILMRCVVYESKF